MGKPWIRDKSYGADFRLCIAHQPCLSMILGHLAVPAYGWHQMRGPYVQRLFRIS